MEVKLKAHDEKLPVYDRETLLKGFDGLIPVARRAGSGHFDEETIEQLMQQSRAEYEKLIPLLPDVGGEKSLFYPLMVQSGQTVAFYRACKNRGLEKRIIGELIYKIAEEQMKSVSRIKKWLARRLVFSDSYRNKWRKAMEESQRREFPMNWAGVFVEGNNDDFGFDFVECGFLKLAQEHGGLEIAPYACICDFVRMRGLGVGYRRTQTLAIGHPRCDFRFSKTYETPEAWPPENLPEVKNSPLGDKAL